MQKFKKIMGNYPFNKVWLWMFLIAIILLIISFVSFFIYGNKNNLTQTPLWIVALLITAIILVILSVIVFIFETCKPRKKYDCNTTGQNYSDIEDDSLDSDDSLGSDEDMVICKKTKSCKNVKPCKKVKLCKKTNQSGKADPCKKEHSDIVLGEKAFIVNTVSSEKANTTVNDFDF